MTNPPNPLHATLRAQLDAYLDTLVAQGKSPRTRESYRERLLPFVDWCGQRSVQYPAQVTLVLLESWQRYLRAYRKGDGQPYSHNGQRERLIALRLWFRWLLQRHHILYNPTEQMVLPKEEKRLPAQILSERETTQVLDSLDDQSVLGLRNRVMLEVLWSSGLRRMELRQLRRGDIDVERGVVVVNQGKGHKDRVVPIGGRALGWLTRYLVQVRPQLADSHDSGYLFISQKGRPLSLGQTPEPDTAPAPASPLAADPASGVMPNVVCESGEHGELRVSVGTQQWCLRGLGAVKAGAVAMKLNAQVLDRQSGVLFADGVDLMSGRSRNSYARLAAAELGLAEGDLRRALGQVLLAVEQWQQQPAKGTEPRVPEMGIAEREAALALLQDPYLTARITTDLAACGVVGESTNLLAGFLAAVSRKLPKPLAVLIQSSSAAGKSSLMEAVLNLIPEEERIQYSAMTGQSLFYLGETHLQHKILAIAEEEGVRQAAYALKLLQSDGELTMCKH